MTRKLENEQIEQLWYTWSTRGLDEIPAGFRIRAASPGLRRIKSREVEQLSRFLRYKLPSGSDVLNTPPDVAPICLAYAYTEQNERILVHKVYTGRDGRNRPGAYFAHILVGLDGLKAHEVIALWRSSFWQRADNEKIDPKIETTSRQEIIARHGFGSLEVQFDDQELLAAQFKDVPFRKNSQERDAASDELHKQLCFVIHAYLLQQSTLEQQQEQRRLEEVRLAELRQELNERKEKPLWDRSGRNLKDIEQDIRQLEAQLQVTPQLPRILIAAPPDTVAYLIAVLIRVMPHKFLQRLTFSTYEQDLQNKGTWSIVGTCLPPTAYDRGSQPTRLLPATSSTTDFVYNTYQASQSKLTEITLQKDKHIPANLPLGSHYAETVVRALETQNYQLIDSFLAEIEQLLPAFELTLHEFLRKYYFQVIAVNQLSLKDLSNLFSDIVLAREMLNNPLVHEQIFHRLYRDSAPLTPEGEKKETRSEHVHWLHQSLPALVRGLRASCQSSQVSPDDAYVINEGLRRLTATALDHLLRAAYADDFEFFLAIHELMLELEPPMPGGQTWVSLLHHVGHEEALQRFALKHWAVRNFLLADACKALTPSNAEHNQYVAPLLKLASSEDFIKLLTGSRSAREPAQRIVMPQLPPEWNVLVTQSFLAMLRSQHRRGSKLPSETLVPLNSAVPQLLGLTKQLLGTRRPDACNAALELFRVLVENKFQAKMELLDTWLAQPVTVKYLDELLAIAQLSTDETFHLLEHFYAPYLIDEKTAALINASFAAIADQLSPESRRQILNNTLQQIVAKQDLKRLRIKKAHVTAMLQIANPTLEDYATMLRQFGPQLLLSPTLAELVPDFYKIVIQGKGGSRQRFPLLKQLLQARPTDPIAEQLLAQAEPDEQEALNIFQTYGQGNFPFCYHAQTTRKLYCQFLPNHPQLKQYLLGWLGKDIQADAVDELLTAAEPVLNAQDRALILEQYGIRELGRNPASSILRALLDAYLANLTGSAFSPSSAQQFMQALHNKLAPVPAACEEQIEAWHTLWDFIQQPSSHQSRILALVEAILNRTFPAVAFIQPLASALATCVESAIQLSVIISTLLLADSQIVSQIVHSMFGHVRTHLNEAGPQDERWPQRACEYLQFALGAEIVDSFSSELKKQLRAQLLDGAPVTFVDLVNRQALNWPDQLSELWQQEKGLHSYQAPFPLPTSIGMSGESGPTINIPSTITSPGKQTAAPIPVLDSLKAWLFYLPINKSFGSVAGKKYAGAGQYALLWDTYMVELQVLDHMLPLEWRQRLKLACDFYSVCWNADAAAPDPDPEAERLIIKLADAHEKEYSSILTAHERARIKLARRRVARPPTVSATRSEAARTSSYSSATVQAPANNQAAVPPAARGQRQQVHRASDLRSHPGFGPMHQAEQQRLRKPKKDQSQKP
ncbi:hypothetical protein EPA93_34405 [Ktedonosporobacter rubrisoli]|uniref:Uncharacterized protein n=1 Tax=Ktedonosporobacter rubrisoli TaxID=2509675 RepID=A0A4P6JYA9_KTERU|nr:hypothetical protein [Ktedonosporobacter rubrisoli]QBD80788.1 hypothetical protein EPA93_34405 [Ktedonosporobacter rubrisoli]